MNKRILEEYVDACELVKETEEEIERLEGKRSTMEVDKVTGSMNEFPYVQTTFRIEGAVPIARDTEALKEQRFLLRERQDNARKIKLRVEHWLNDAPTRIQRIVRYHYFSGMSWRETAEQMRRNATGESVRKELERFLMKK